MALALRSLRVTYPGGHVALDDVSLDVPAGLFGLLGPNGAGKSTLMRVVATLQRPDAGTVTLDGRDALADPAAVRRRLGYLPQDFGFPPNVPVQELLAHFAALEGYAPRATRAAVVADLLQRVNLWEARARPAGALSGGMRQRLGLAIALCGDPALLILDEPTAGLDPAERHRLYDLLAACGERATVLLSTHLVEDVQALCPAMAILHCGRLVAAGAPGALVAPLRGRLWERPLGDGEGQGDAHALLRVRRRGGQRVASLLADAPPDARCTTAEPTLEDAYFAYVREDVPRVA